MALVYENISPITFDLLSVFCFRLMLMFTVFITTVFMKKKKQYDYLKKITNIYHFTLFRYDLGGGYGCRRPAREPLLG